MKHIHPNELKEGDWCLKLYLKNKHRLFIGKVVSNHPSKFLPLSIDVSILGSSLYQQSVELEPITHMSDRVYYVLSDQEVINTVLMETI